MEDFDRSIQETNQEGLKKTVKHTFPNFAYEKVAYNYDAETKNFKFQFRITRGNFRAEISTLKDRLTISIFERKDEQEQFELSEYLEKRYAVFHEEDYYDRAHDIKDWLVKCINFYLQGGFMIFDHQKHNSSGEGKIEQPSFKGTSNYSFGSLQYF